MTRGLRRTLVFVAMVAAGLAVVLLLADPFQRRRTAPSAPSRADDDPRLKVKDASQREIEMAFGDVSFDVLPEDAEEGDPPLYRVHIKSGRPDASGAFLAESPLITLLDQKTGQPTGELSADQARFELGRAVGGSATIELGRMRVGHSELRGNVRGRFTTADGAESHLACETLIMREEVVEAPGLVTWKREDLSVSGYDLRWDGETGRLDFATGARLVLPALGERPGFDLLGPGGLTLDVPPDAPDPRTASHAELRGRVVGTSTDGRTLEADLLVLDGPAGTVTLTGDAAVEGELPGGERARLTAQRIVTALDEQGAIAQAEAEGDVRLSARSASTWLTTGRLLLAGSVATSPERVTWGHEDLGGAGTGMRWDLEAGTLVLESQAEIGLAPEAEHPLAGLRIVTPAGMSWELETGTGQMQGPLHGTLPDGTSFDGDRLAFAGEAEGVRLEGHAVARRETPDLRSLVSASTITIVGAGAGAGEDAGAAQLEAEGQVVVESGAPGLPPTRLLAERLRAREGHLHGDGPFQWTRGGLVVEGEGLDWNETEGRIELERDARITLVDAARSLDVRAHAQGGMTWVAPPDAQDPLAEGRGEMRGGVTGSSADGSRLEAERALIDGPADTVTLLGRARIVTPGPRTGAEAGPAQMLRLDSERLVISALRGTPRVESDVAVEWELGDSSGTAVGLDWDGAARHLRLQREVELQLAAAPGQPAGGRWTVTADGSLDWQAPPETEPTTSGHLELQGDIVGRSDQGQTFRTEHLVAEGEQGLIRLLGPSSFELLADAGRMRLVAQRSILLRTAGEGDETGDAGGGGERLVAEGEVRATLTTPEGGPPLEVTGERLTLAGEQRTLIVEGPVSVARGEGEDRMTLTAAQHLLVRVNERNEPAWFEADGDVRLSRGFEARGDSLWWDVPADQAQLQGACRMDFAGAVMHFERAEFAPRARTFKILRSTLSADG